ncbi:transcriptional regulator [Streptantibioticus parmotrematis]|uniref:transcriptional regulator n=1 Tax=Streptantibioticus parmotrematis TaxID=2873249 RepID=UPI0033FBB01D
MHTADGGSLACPATARQQRLVAQLADMIPGVATIRVSLKEPGQTWPHPYAIAKDAAGQTIDLNRATSRVAARWILRVWPALDWNRVHTFDFATATLTRSGLATGRGR